MKTLNRIIFLLTVSLIFVVTVPFVSAYAVDTETKNYTLTLENTCEDSFSADSSAFGRVSFFSRTQFNDCYGNQLTGVAKEMYDSLVKNYVTDKLAGEYIYTFNTPLTFEAEISGGSIVSNDKLEEISLELQYASQIAMDAFLYDHPEVFWLKVVATSCNISASGNSSSGYTGYIRDIKFIPYEIYSGASSKISQYDGAVASVLNSITVSESRYDTLKNIHDYICENAWYNLVKEQRVYSSEPFFIGDGGVVCEGYAKTFKVICDRLDIPCVLVSGDAGGAHMWNYVQMEDNKWYLVDATWDDQKSKIYDTYFLADANTIGFDGVSINKERTERNDFSGTGIFNFTYPVLSTTTYTVHVHEWDSYYTVDVESTCTVKGTKSIHCKTCDAKKNITVISATGHTEVKISGKAATCTATGLTDGKKCSVCGAVTVKQVIIAKKSHNIIIIDGKAATCTSTGLTEGKHCSVCGTVTVEQEVIAKKPHTVVTIKGKAATCTATGLTDGKKCSVCGTITVKQTSIAKKSHTYKTTTTKATLTKNGKTVKKCSVCDYVSKTTTIYYPKTIKLSATSYTYNGKAITPTVTVKDSKGKTLKKDTDYTVKYASGRKNTGKYTVTVTFKGNYSGTKTLAFNILPSKTSKITISSATTAIKASWSKVTGVSGYKVELLNSKGKVVKTATTTKTSYTFKSLSKVTTYKVRVTAYKTIDKKAVYSTVSTTIITSTAPATVTLSKVTAGSKSATASWKKVSGATGYEVMYSTSSKFSSSKTADVSKGSTVKQTIKKLTKGKKHYFKVRAYKTVDGKKIYGAWSAVKNVKVK